MANRSKHDEEEERRKRKSKAIQEEEDEDEDEDDEEYEDEDEDEGEEGEEDPTWWMPHVVAGALIIIGILGYLGAFSKFFGPKKAAEAEVQSEAKVAAATTPVRVAPTPSQLRLPARLPAPPQ